MISHLDDIRELNGHAEDEIKRQRLHYGSDQLYSVSFNRMNLMSSILISNDYDNRCGRPSGAPV